MSFEADFQAAALSDLLDGTIGLGEAATVTYTPSGGSATSLSAIVIREPLQQRGPRGAQRHEYKLSVWINRDDLSADPIVNVDTIAVKVNADDAGTQTLKVRKILNQDGGGWHLALN